MIKKAEIGESQKQMLLNDIKILKEMDHPNILKTYEFYEDDSKLSLVTDVVKGRNLLDEIIARGKFDEVDCSKVMRIVLSCIAYCHEKHITHRDLRPENILIDSKQGKDTIKILNFGTSLPY